jgi:hypothetical protein
MHRPSPITGAVLAAVVALTTGCLEADDVPAPTTHHEECSCTPPAEEPSLELSITEATGVRWQGPAARLTLSSSEATSKSDGDLLLTATDGPRELELQVSIQPSQGFLAETVTGTLQTVDDGVLATLRWKNGKDGIFVPAGTVALHLEHGRLTGSFDGGPELGRLEIDGRFQPVCLTVEGGIGTEDPGFESPFCAQFAGLRGD